MYSESDIDAAVTAGALSPEAAAALRRHVALRRAAPAADEESFRLLNGFNDIFVAVAALLLLASVGWIGGFQFGGAAVALLAWLLAEYFTRVRRMALPSILLHAAFVGGVFAAALALCAAMAAVLGREAGGADFAPALSAGVAALASWAHWRRFRVPITVAIAAGTVCAALILGAGQAFPTLVESTFVGLLFCAGAAVFILAMKWDMSDPLRQTRRADVAFWLHLLAAPLLVHTLFAVLGLFDQAGTPALKAVLVLVVYAAMGFVALAIDRRALLVSALAYVLGALSALFKHFGAVSLSLALTALIIGSALLLLSALWPRVRRRVVLQLPAALRAKLPPVGV